MRPNGKCRDLKSTLLGVYLVIYGHNEGRPTVLLISIRRPYVRADVGVRAGGDSWVNMGLPKECEDHVLASFHLLRPYSRHPV